MITTTGRPPQTVESLKGLIGWFNHNSIELIEEYRRLEERVDDLKGESRYEVTESKSRKLKGAFLLIAIHVQYPSHS